MVGALRSDAPVTEWLNARVSSMSGIGAPERGTSSNPLVYEINTWPWLAQLARREGKAVDLGSVPEHVWDRIAALGFDAVWLMGVWQRSPAGIRIALANEGLVADFRAALPDWRPEDVVGSPYCIRGYVVDAALGGPEGLAAAREALAVRGLRLILDFVPNHVAPDHPWLLDRPEVCLLGTDEQLERDPASFVRIGGRVFARGRDPYFPAWPDVVQLNAFSPRLRETVVETLLDIAGQCDGVRCDMAMLMMTDVFARTWGEAAGPAPAADYWPDVIPRVRAVHPGFLFVAEAYWDLEWALQQQGFDHCYDKRLYDRLVHGSAEEVRGHLHADLEYQRRSVRFVENHDEPRAAAAFGAQRSRTAAVATLTQSGLRLVHDGQISGAAVRLPVFLGRFPDETPDGDLERFYEALLPAVADRAFHEGAWELCRIDGWPDNPSYRDLVGWTWTADDARRLVVVNLGGSTASGLVRTPWGELRGRGCDLVDPTGHVTYSRSGDDLADGLFVELAAGAWHLFEVDVRMG